MKRIVYICSPYRGNDDAERIVNVFWANHYCRFAAMQDAIPVAPHLLFPQFLDDDNPEDRRLALEMGLEMLHVVDELWVCGNVITEGMRAEIAEASRLGKTVRHIAAFEKRQEKSEDNLCN